MKLFKFAAVLATSLFAITSFAKSEEDMNKKTKSEITNPLTGRKHIKEKEKTHVKNAHGETEVDAVKKTVVNTKTGKVEKEKVDIEGESTSKGE